MTMPRQIGDGSLLDFHVDRSLPSCHTPRRNADVEQALKHALELARWAAVVHGRCVSRVLNMHSGPSSPTPVSRLGLCGAHS